MEILILCGIYLAELMCYLLGLRILFEVKYKTKYWMIVGSLFPLIIKFLSVDVAGKNFIVTVIILCIMFISVEGKVGEKGIRLVFVFLLLACIEKICEFPCKKFMVADDVNYIENVNYLIVKCFTVASIIIMYSVKKKFSEYTKEHINSAIYFIIGVIVVSMVFCLEILNYAIIYLPGNKYVVFCNILNITIYISIFLLIVFVLYIKSTHERMKQLLKTEQLLKESQVNYYRQILKKETDTRNYRHDMVNHLIYVQDILSRNKTNDAQEYLANILGGFKKIQNTYYIIGNEMVETIMNYFFGMLPKNVVIEIKGRCPVDIDIEDTDVCTIFSNLFQNAVEEIIENDIENSKIIVKVQKGRQYVEYNIKNSIRFEIDNKYIDKNGLPKSHKEDKRNHGIGMVNVKKTVERNHGKFEWYQINGYFCVDVVLPIK